MQQLKIFPYIGLKSAFFYLFWFLRIFCCTENIKTFKKNFKYGETAHNEKHFCGGFQKYKNIQVVPFKKYSRATTNRVGHYTMQNNFIG